MALALIIEDNPGEIDLLREAFRDSEIPIELHVASTATEAFEYMRRIGDPDGGNFLAVQIAMGWLKARFDGQKIDPGCTGGG